VLAQDLELDPTSQHLMRIIFRETERLNSLITDFLLYARPAPRNIQKVRMDRLISDIIEVYKNRTDIPGDIKWSLEVEPSLEIETDPKLLEQILWNLVNNAVDSMADRGELCIRAYSERPGKDSLSDGNETGAEESPQPVAAIEVEDSGPGISPEIKDKIFDPFFTTRDTGTGLGLSTVYRIVEAMEGSVAVKDAREKGTVFEIKIPMRQKPAEETGNGESTSNGAGLTGGG
jgi:two-component system sensor histidine kinase PilS (NtrC family)